MNETTGQTFLFDRLSVKLYSSRQAMGEYAAQDAAQKICYLLGQKREIRMIFAAAPSQNEFLQALVANKDIDFSRITAFHMDEYIGLQASAPQGFGNFLRHRLFEKAPFKAVHYLNGNAGWLEQECARYSALLMEADIDIVCMGIGENGHLAFNDPPLADFTDPCLVKVVRLDPVCRMQQVNDGCFSSVDEVPAYALTLTIPALTKVGSVFCIVPGKTKQQAVQETLLGDIQEGLPATILRRCKNATLYLDPASGEFLRNRAVVAALADTGAERM